MSVPIDRETSTGSVTSYASLSSKLRLTGNTPHRNTIVTTAENTPRQQKPVGNNTPRLASGTETSIRSFRQQHTNNKFISATPQRGVNISDPVGVEDGDEAVQIFGARTVNIMLSDNEEDNNDDDDDDDGNENFARNFAHREKLVEKNGTTPHKRVEFGSPIQTDLFNPDQNLLYPRINQTGVHMDSDNEDNNASSKRLATPTKPGILNKTPQRGGISPVNVNGSSASEIGNAVANLSLHTAARVTGQKKTGAKANAEKNNPVTKQRAVRRMGDEFNSGPGGDDDLGEQIRVVLPGQAENNLKKKKLPTGPVPTVQEIISCPYKQPIPDFGKDLVVDDENPRIKGPEAIHTITEDPETALAKFETLYLGWCARTSAAYHNPHAQTDRNDVRHHLERLFGLDGTDYNVANVQQCYEIMKLQYAQVRQILKQHNFDKKPTPRGEPNTYAREMQRIEEMMYDGFHALMFMLQFEFTRDGKQNTFNSEEMSVFRFKSVANSKLQDEHKLVLHLVKEARIRDLRIDGDLFYRQRRTAVGAYPMSSWRKYANLYEFMGEVCDKETHFDMWARWVSHPRTAFGYLRDFPDSDLRKYKPDWGVIAYEDALYHQESDTFWAHDDKNKPKHLVAQWYIPLKADRTVVTDDPFVIKTPILKILVDQGYNKQEQFIFSALIGRLFFPVRHLDKFELALFMWGEAQTGKSTFINCIRAFFNPDNVGKISNKQEEIFGLESIYDKMFAECSDVTRVFKMDTGDLLAICSGEYTAVKRKNKIQLSAKWVVPVVFAGNEFPASWVDKKKNLLRRIFIADFPKQITPDLNFASEIARTLASSHRFFIVCYLKLLQEIKESGMDIWAIVEKSCPRFIKNREELLMQNSPLLAFLFDTKDVEMGKDYYTPQNELIAQFTAWLTLRSMKSEGEMRPQRLKEILASQGCTVQNTAKIWPDDGVNSMLKQDDYVIGLRFKSIGGGGGGEGRTVEQTRANIDNDLEENAYQHNAMAIEEDPYAPQGIAV